MLSVDACSRVRKLSSAMLCYDIWRYTIYIELFMAPTSYVATVIAFITARTMCVDKPLVYHLHHKHFPILLHNT
jgi:hypothetical protein